MLVGDILVIIYSITLSILALVYEWDNMKLEEEIEDLEEELKQKEKSCYEKGYKDGLKCGIDQYLSDTYGL